MLNAAMRFVAVIVIFGGAVLTSPAAVAQIAEEDRSAALADAFVRLRAAPAPDEAGRFENEIWTLWFIGPDGEATALLKEAQSRIRGGMFDEAHIRLNAILASWPDFTEAWNQRAFAKFLKGDLNGSLADIHQVLKREPRHFGALAGRARIEARLGDPGAAARTMGELGAVHPWMARRSAIPADPPPPEPGEAL